MASPDIQPMWVPYETIKDCSQGFCSIYCPQWCYVFFPPPPPQPLSDPAGPNLSPLVIAVIGIIASAFLLVGYYALISRYCTRLDSLRRRLAAGGDPSSRDTPGGPLHPHHDGWQAPPGGGGLDAAVIKSIGAFRYRPGEGLVQVGGDCAVCLGEFGDGDGLRLLPKCGHAFHVPCIDAWLFSHATCPLCRAAVLPQPSPAPPLLPTSPLDPPDCPPSPETPVAAVAGDVEVGSIRVEDPAAVEGRGGLRPIRRSFSMDAAASHLSRVSVADVLGVDMEAESPKEGLGLPAMAEGEGSSTGYGTGHHHFACKECSHMPMKRSFSSGRFCFTRQGKGAHGDGILPL